MDSGENRGGRDQRRAVPRRGANAGGMPHDPERDRRSGPLSDPLSDLLRAVRVRAAVFYYLSCRDTWSAEAPPAAEIAQAVLPGCEHVSEFHMIAKGGGWAVVAGEPPLRLRTGDVVMFPHGDSHVLSSAPGIRPIRRSAEWVFASRDAPRPIPVAYHDGVVQPGARLPLEQASMIAVCGFLGCDLQPFNPLLGALPRMLHLPAAQAAHWLPHVLDQAVDESRRARPGANAVLERMAEMMFVDAARRHLATLPEDATGWLAALRDRFVGKALCLLHARVDHAWSVDELAREVGLSRSALHQRFTRLLGQGPAQYLAAWRMQLGASMLRDSARPVCGIAQEVGYASEAAFSRAFKRRLGMPPAAWRRSRTP